MASPQGLVHPHGVRRGVLGLWVGVTAACTSSAPFLEVPHLDEDSLLLARFDPGLSLEGYELGPEPYLGVPLEGYRTAYVARYRCPLSGLGMAPGPQVVGLDPSYTALPPSPRVSRAELGLGDLEPIEGWPEPLAALRVKRAPDPAPCRSFTADTFPLVSPNPNPTRVLARLGERRAVLWQASGAALELSEAGVVPLARLSTTTPYLGGAVDARGEFFLTGRGRSAFVDAAGQWRPGPPLPDDSDGVQHLAFDPERGFTEVFLLGDAGRLWRFDGATWTELQVEREAFENDRDYGLLYRGPGRVAAVGLLANAVVTWESGRAGTLPLPDLEAGDYPVVITTLPEEGLVLGTKLGNLVLEEGGAWRRVEGDFRSRPRHFFVFDGGLYFGGRGGVFEQYHSGYGLCTSTAIASDNTTLVSEIDGLLMMVTLGQVGTEEVAVVATPGPKPVLGCPEP